MAQRYRRMEDQKPGLTHNQDFSREERFLPKVKKFSEYVQMGRCGEQTSVTQAYHRWGSVGKAGGYRDEFCNFLEKIVVLIPLDHISHVF